ncbi:MULTISPECIES: hydroxymethylglutaryl-CoA lyase [unclassified Brevibacterium]|uniref:hydroxymethylglutaryl-CoA lyase n=1 Tax=unclassified Brevibacterium TaxID=2614124 RepID=UPI001E524BAA|nr:MULTISPECIES: hydroxymethylglutaryl-CoA lyase [unclassified Brevibacterium]MCD1286153.1 hydroxymethylglutaryl-CoA lyase [Brevibacterium sp. CCUG 69071]MDK8433511.1 hydroxymethylglutaryl-CoA lyase [Brevibacterium sp. H-BE7]
MVRPSRVHILDTTLRDGLQIEKTIVPTDAKVALAERLIAAGLTELEIGSFVNPKKVPQMADTDEVLRRLQPYEAEGVELFTLVFNLKGAERAVDAGAKNIKLVLSASEGHSQANSDAPIAQASERLLLAAEYARDQGLRFDISTAVSFICPFDGITEADHLVEVLRPFVDAGAHGIGVADTIGNANPSLVRRNTSAVLEAFPGKPVNLHLHDTYNFGMANVIAALDLGIANFDAAMGGLGGCPFAPGAAGNIGTDDLVHLLHREGVATGVDVAALTEVREPLISAVGHDLTSSLSDIPATPAVFDDRFAPTSASGTP